MIYEVLRDAVLFSNQDRSKRQKTRTKIFGIGNLRTGTTSLGSALEILGYKHTHKNRETLLQYVKANELDKVYQ